MSRECKLPLTVDFSRGVEKLALPNSPRWSLSQGPSSQSDNFVDSPRVFPICKWISEMASPETLSIIFTIELLTQMSRASFRPVQARRQHNKRGWYNLTRLQAISIHQWCTQALRQKEVYKPH